MKRLSDNQMDRTRVQRSQRIISKMTGVMDRPEAEARLIKTAMMRTGYSKSLVGNNNIQASSSSRPSTIAGAGRVKMDIWGDKSKKQEVDPEKMEGKEEEDPSESNNIHKAVSKPLAIDVSVGTTMGDEEDTNVKNDGEDNENNSKHPHAVRKIQVLIGNSFNFLQRASVNIKAELAADMEGFVKIYGLALTVKHLLTSLHRWLQRQGVLVESSVAPPPSNAAVAAVLIRGLIVALILECAKLKEAWNNELWNSFELSAIEQKMSSFSGLHDKCSDLFLGVARLKAIADLQKDGRTPSKSGGAGKVSYDIIPSCEVPNRRKSTIITPASKPSRGMMFIGQSGVYALDDPSPIHSRSVSLDGIEDAIISSLQQEHIQMQPPPPSTTFIELQHQQILLQQQQQQHALDAKRAKAVSVIMSIAPEFVKHHEDGDKNNNQSSNQQQSTEHENNNNNKTSNSSDETTAHNQMGTSISTTILRRVGEDADQASGGTNDPKIKPPEFMLDVANAALNEMAENHAMNPSNCAIEDQQKEEQQPSDGHTPQWKDVALEQFLGRMRMASIEEEKRMMEETRRIFMLGLTPRKPQPPPTSSSQSRSGGGLLLSSRHLDVISPRVKRLELASTISPSSASTSTPRRPFYLKKRKGND